MPEGDDGDDEEQRGRTEERHDDTQPGVGEERLERGASQIEGSHGGVDEEQDENGDPTDEMLAVHEHDVGIET